MAYGMHPEHTSYAMSDIESVACKHYIMCMTKERTKTYMGTFPADVNASNSQLYAELLQRVREFNYSLRGNERKFVLRKRYRGTRIGKKYNRQSMCLKKDATRCDVYLYFERKESPSRDALRA